MVDPIKKSEELQAVTEGILGNVMNKIGSVFGGKNDEKTQYEQLKQGFINRSLKKDELKKFYELKQKIEPGLDIGKLTKSTQTSLSNTSGAVNSKQSVVTPNKAIKPTATTTPNKTSKKQRATAQNTSVSEMTIKNYVIKNFL